MTDPRPRILAIDDTPANLFALGAALSREFDLQTATSGLMGIALALASPPDLILLDVMMPGMDGFETCQRIKAMPQLQDIPVIFVTVLNETASEAKGLALGAADYIAKPINVQIARQRIRNLLERERLRKEVEAHRDLLETRVAERNCAQMALEQANAALAARALQAEEASAAKTRFLSNVSHELRTPLHTILGYVRLLLRATEGEAKRQLAIVERSSAQLLKLIDDLLEFNQEANRSEALQPDAVELQELMRQLKHTGQLMARQWGNRFAVTLADDLPTALWVDEQRLLQVMQNLLGNACKYTRNGSVTLSVARENGSHLTAGSESCRVHFSVEDSGIGISPKDQDQIFDAFNRGTSGHGQPGLGLGLAIARQWVNAMGGDIQVRSVLGQGSRFFFTLELPTATMKPPTSFAACDAFRDQLAATPRTLLVVDDIAENRLLLIDLCERWGFHVLEASNGDSALMACLGRASTPRIDAVLVDQWMPNMSGWEFLRQAREIPALAQLTTILVSASAAQKPLDFPPGIDFDRVLGKPLDEQALACFLCQRLTLVACSTGCCLHPASASESIVGLELPAQELARFRQMLNLGRVVRIEEWVQELAAQQSTYTDFAGQVVQYCRAGDLGALEKLAEAMVPSPDKPT